MGNTKELTKTREVLVEMRGNWIKAIAAGYQNGKTEDAMKGLIEVQQAIEVIDCAIDEADEDDDEDEDE